MTGDNGGKSKSGITITNDIIHTSEEFVPGVEKCKTQEYEKEIIEQATREFEHQKIWESILEGEVCFDFEGLGQVCASCLFDRKTHQQATKHRQEKGLEWKPLWARK